MKSCFLFGHRDTPGDIVDRLSEAMIRHHLALDIRTFVIGHYGAFDRTAVIAAQKVKLLYADTHFLLLLPYHPTVHSVELPDGFDGTLYLEGMEAVPPKAAIVRANQLMVQKASSIICYVNRPGNARNLLEHAIKKSQKEAFCIENLASNIKKN